MESHHADNGAFTAQSFIDKMHCQDQQIKFSGVGAHRQNGVAERAVGTVFSQERTQLLHAQLCWHGRAQVSLWPMSTQHAFRVHNIVPIMHTGLSPDKVFSRATSNHAELLALRPWGCPAHALDPTLQNGKKLFKWKPRARRGQPMGWSPVRASSVSLAQNLSTGFLLLQFRVVFDPWFEAATCNEEKLADSWPALMSNHQFKANADQDTALDDEWLTKEELIARKKHEETKENSRPSAKQEGGRKGNWQPQETRGNAQHPLPTAQEGNSKTEGTSQAE